MPPKKIVIVDDEQDVLESLSRRLKGDGFEVITATRGNEAVQKVKETSPDLVLIDIVLPDIDGPEVLLLLQQDAASRKIPVIFFSGIVSKAEQGYCSEIKACGRDYPAIGKPFPYEELLKMIRRYI